MITTTARQHQLEGRLRRFCGECGGKTFVACPSCNEPIKGAWPPDPSGLMQVPGFRGLRNYCANCGAAYPWTQARLDSAKELIATLEGVSAEEKAQLSRDLADLMRDTARTEVAATYFKKLYLKVKGPAKAVLERIALQLFTEGAKAFIGTL